MSEVKKRGMIFVISGPSGVGKGTLVKELQKRRNYGFSVSHTTRTIRPGEKDGVSYHFVTKDAFQMLVDGGKMMEYTCYNGNYYGTSFAAVMDAVEQGQDMLVDIEVEGAANLRNACPEAFEIFLLPPSLAELERRLRGRGTEDEEVIQARLARAREEIACAPHYDYIIVDRTPEQAADEIEEIIVSIKRRAAFRSEMAERVLAGQEI